MSLPALDVLLGVRSGLDPIGAAGSDPGQRASVNFRWATVTQTGPLRVRLDGDSDPLPFTPDNLVGPVPVGTRVWCELFGRRVIAIGVQGGIGAGIVTVDLFGARGDGSTDDTVPIQAAIDSLPGGGTVRFRPGGTYKVTSPVTLRSNVVVDGTGATVNATNGLPFAARSTGKGYGAGGENITVRGFRFDRGNFAGSSMMSFHHAQHVLIEDCVWEGTVISSHGIDLPGSRDVTIRRCVFKGDRDGTPYKESINLDWSYIGGTASQVNDAPSSYDGLPCRDILIEDCVSTDFTVGGTHYDAPNLVGSHASCEGGYITNVQVVNCVVRNPRPLGSAAVAGLIHGYMLRDILVQGCTFLYDRPSPPQVKPVRSGQITSWKALADVGTPDSGNVSCPPQVPMNFRVVDCIFDGFTNASDYSLIDINGNSSTHGYGVEVTGCHVRNCNASPDTGGSNGATLVTAEYMDDVRVHHNETRNMDNTAIIRNGTRVSVCSNTVYSPLSTALYVDTCDDVDVSGNTISGGFAGILVSGGTGAVISNNSVAGSQTSGNSSALNIHDVTELLVNGNLTRGVGPGSRTKYVYGCFLWSNTNGLFVNNRAAGSANHLTGNTNVDQYNNK